MAHFTQEEKGLLVTCFRCDSSSAVITIEGFFCILLNYLDIIIILFFFNFDNIKLKGALSSHEHIEVN